LQNDTEKQFYLVQDNPGQPDPITDSVFMVYLYTQ